MSQCHWTYITTADKQFQIGLYHGLESGHVMLHCDQNPLIIDFSIKESKDYHFYIEEEMLTLNICKNEDDSFSYSLMRDDTIITPFTIALKNQNNRYNLVAAFLGLSVVLLILLLIWYYYHS